MSLTVSCLTCKDPQNDRRIVSWPQSCRECADLCASQHLEAFPDHKVEITGFVSERPFSVGWLLGERRVS